MKKRQRARGDVWKYGASILGRRQIDEKWTNEQREAETVRISGHWRELIKERSDRHKVGVKEISTEESRSWAKVA